MAEAPWRCSECGTINEPVANSCRTCGRWPSLFDLEEGVVDEVHVPTVAEEPGFEVEPFQPETFEVGEIPVEVAAERETPTDRRRRVLTSLIVPLAFVVYIVISILFGDR